MPIHDAYARITPYELFLPEEGYADRRFPDVEREAELRKAPLADPDAFALFSEAGAILREIRGEGDDPQLIRQYGALLFHAFHFWRAGSPLYLLETGVLRYLAETGPREGEWSPSLPGGSGYVQLPQHLVWTTGGEGAHPESVDGLFWSAPDGESLSLMLVMGVRKDRPGVVVVPLPTLPLGPAGEWASLRVREEGEDFSSSLPGAELERLYALEAGAEAVKLAMRIFWYLDTFPGSVVEGPPAPADAKDPRPTALSYRRVVLGEGS